MSGKTTTKRILREAAELANSPSPDYHAAPLESDLFEWHFTLRGPPSPSPFEGGIYHGRIVLPPAYPLKPPSFRFLTPTGRFESNREICLSISGHHEETWQPAWGIRTALVAIRSFMDTDAKGQLGGMDASEEVRRKLAGQSRGWKCGACGGRSNEEIMRDLEERVEKEGAEAGKKEEEVPEGLRLAYREELKGEVQPRKEGEQSVAAATSGNVSSADATTSAVAVPAAQQQPAPTATVLPAQRLQQRAPPGHDEGVPPWIDKAIYGIIGALLYLLWKKFA
ncbi:uncharacterized protein LTR77_007179 [Saxophila tyrrhenica]|uniref:UBC core domain-containing protein n=1 Tax=Saxophila tyrrhenica TaxID=1690608 RepID=A0AAV9P7X9_9PEZI|nr:hypothetical protein LTR77_007179 [Saxophila tyrrhenica]